MTNHPGRRGYFDLSIRCTGEAWRVDAAPQIRVALRKLFDRLPELPVGLSQSGDVLGFSDKVIGSWRYRDRAHARQRAPGGGTT